MSHCDRKRAELARRNEAVFCLARARHAVIFAVLRTGSYHQLLIYVPGADPATFAVWLGTFRHILVELGVDGLTRIVNRSGIHGDS